MRKDDSIQKIIKGFQEIYKDYTIKLWQGGDCLKIGICDLRKKRIVCVFEFEFKHKWKFKNVRTY